MDVVLSSVWIDVFFFDFSFLFLVCFCVLVSPFFLAISFCLFPLSVCVSLLLRGVHADSRERRKGRQKGEGGRHCFSM